MKRKLINKIVLVIVLTCMLAVSIFMLRYVKDIKNNEIVENEEIIVEPIAEPIEEIAEIKEESFSKLDWENNYSINNDYIGRLKFHSGLIDIDFVKGETNDTYLRKDWKTLEYDECGSVFLDSDCDVDSFNMIIYGHYVYESFIEDAKDMMFTPLVKLLEKDNYKDNDLIDIYLYNQKRTYQVAYVFYCPLTEDENGDWYADPGLEYFWADYTQEKFDEYINNVKENVLYDTGISVDYNDKLLTLQTCVENRADLREIVICKLIDTKEY